MLPDEDALGAKPKALTEHRRGIRAEHFGILAGDSVRPQLMHDPPDLIGRDQETKCLTIAHKVPESAIPVAACHYRVDVTRRDQFVRNGRIRQIIVVAQVYSLGSKNLSGSGGAKIAFTCFVRICNSD